MNPSNTPHDQTENDQQEQPLFSFDMPGAGWDEGVFNPDAEEALKRKQDGNK